MLINKESHQREAFIESPIRLALSLKMVSELIGIVAFLLYGFSILFKYHMVSVDFLSDEWILYIAIRNNKQGNIRQLLYL